MTEVRACIALLAVLLACPVLGQSFQFMPEQTLTPSLVGPPGGGIRLTLPAPGDFDGDGFVDIAFMTGVGFEIQQNLGAGRYQGSSITEPLVWQSFEMDAVDFDGDGRADLALITANTIEVFESEGGLLFAPPVSVPLPGNGDDNEIVFADFDGNGRVDVARIDYTALRVSFQTSAWSFTPPVTLLTVPAGSLSPVIVAADLDGDGDSDLATSITRSGGGHELLRNDGAGNFGSFAGFTVSFSQAPTAIAAGDVDGDGDEDLVMGSPFPTVEVHLNQGNGVFVPAPGTVSSTLFPGACSLHVSDIDRDGDLDIVTGGSRLAVLVNTGSGQFLAQTGSRWGPPGDFLLEVRVRDYDGDDDPDVAIDPIFGPPQIVTNHARQLVSASRPSIGGQLEIDIYSGPGFGTSGLAMLWGGAALLGSPVPIPGIEGSVQLVPSTAGVVRWILTDTVGVSRVFQPLPINPQLIGVGVFLQHATLPFSGATPGFGNAIFETVLP